MLSPASRIRSAAAPRALAVLAMVLAVGCASSSSSGTVTVSTLATPVATVAGGVATTGTVTLSGPAPGGGATVALASGGAAATVPSNVAVVEGATSATFAISTTPVAADTRVTLTASLNGASQATELLVMAPALASVSVAPSSVQGGAPSTGTATLASAAPPGGLAVALASSSATATVPASVTVAAGATSATFPVTTAAVVADVAVTITGSLGTDTRTAVLAVTVVPVPPALASVSVSPASVQGGVASTGTVTLTSVALAGGAVVSLESSAGAASVPATVTVPAGDFVATFPIATTSLLASTSVTITGRLGAVARTAVLNVRPDPCAFLADGAQWLGFSSNRYGTYDLFAVREDGTCLRQLTQGAGEDLFVTWSRAGLFAYMSARSGRLQVWLQSIDATDSFPLGTGDLAATSPAFSPAATPGGARVAFEGYAPGVTGTSDIYVVWLDGGTPTKLTDGLGYNAGPAWSPDGQTIYFVSNRSGRYDVYRVPAAGGPVAAVTTSSGILGRPTVTPDGLSLGYCRAAAGEAFSEVVVRNIGTGAIRVISSQKDCEPAFDRTGEHVVVSSQRSGNPELLLLDVATGAVVRTLAASTGIDGLAAFAPFP